MNSSLLPSRLTPCVSIIIPTYNRADTLNRAIDSVLSQDYIDFELIVVDDGSVDNTQQLLLGYTDPRIVSIKHNVNRGVTAALNTGLNAMRGEWFTFLGSDDEMISTALSTMLSVLKDISSEINAVTANCIDTTTGELSGKGLNCDQWLDFETLITSCTGEHFGITKKSLLGDLRFNEKLRGGESIVWYKISLHAKRYYIHKGLRIYHTEGSDRICQKTHSVNIKDRITYYREIAHEVEYLELLHQYRPLDYGVVQRNIALSMVMEGKQKKARNAYRVAKPFIPYVHRLILLFALFGGRFAAQAVINIALKVR